MKIVTPLRLLIYESLKKVEKNVVLPLPYIKQLEFCVPKLRQNNKANFKIIIEGKIFFESGYKRTGNYTFAVEKFLPVKKTRNKKAILPAKK